MNYLQDMRLIYNKVKRNERVSNNELKTFADFLTSVGIYLENL